MQRADVIVIGAGIVGLATAYRFLERFSGKTLVVLEKESGIAMHQTGHNSGVLHSGIYYRPGSLKASNCRTGKQAMEAFCREQEIPFEICGKVIVATTAAELGQLDEIYRRGQANGVRCDMIDRTRLEQLEPHAAGIRAIHVPEAGTVDFKEVCLRLAACIERRGARIATGAHVRAVEQHADGVTLESRNESYHAAFVVNCAGLFSDRVTRLAGQKPAAPILPFRGEYYELVPEAREFCRTMIYPVPDARFPFLGVHFTRGIDSHVHCGPNAVLALAREGYRKSDVRLGDLFEALTYPGFLRLAARHWRIGVGEMWRSISKRAFVRALQRLVPEIQPKHLLPAPAGVRAQAVGRDGQLIDDFLVQASGRIVHVGNAPSPAATASLNIGEYVVDRLAEIMP